MATSANSHDDSIEDLRLRLAEAEEMLRAIREGEIDALVVEGSSGSQLYTLHGPTSRTACWSTRCRKAPWY